MGDNQRKFDKILTSKLAEIQNGETSKDVSFTTK